MADSPHKDLFVDFATLLEADINGAPVPSLPPRQIEDYDDISTYVWVRADNDALVLVPPTEHTNGASMIPTSPTKESALGLNSGNPSTLERSKQHPPQQETAGNPSTLERSILNPVTQQPPQQETAGNSSTLERPVTQQEAAQLEDNNGPDIDGFFEENPSLALEYLLAIDDDLKYLTDAHKDPICPLYDTQEMTSFQRLVRPLVEFMSVPHRKATVYQGLKDLCQPDIVRPYSVRSTSYQKLVDIGIRSAKEAMEVLFFARNFDDDGDLAGGDHMESSLSEDLLNEMSDNQIFERIQSVSGVDGYTAFTMLLFGLGKMLNVWPIEQTEFKLQYELWYYSKPMSDVQRWEPFRGLAAWLIWSYY